MKKARSKALKLRLTCSICSEKAKLNCPCGTTQYCSTECQRIDWRDRGHRKACKKSRNERAAEAARGEAPTVPPPPEEVFYGPAPRSHADEVRARIAAEHEAARARREAEPAPEPYSERRGSRCPVCFEDWDVNSMDDIFRSCCGRMICGPCVRKIGYKPCPLCRTPYQTMEECLAGLRRHAENDVPEAVFNLGFAYDQGIYDLPINPKKAAKIYKRAVELGNLEAMVNLGRLYAIGEGVKMDSTKATRLDRMAADRGFAKAQCALANEYFAAGDFVEGARYCRLAAEQGLTEAEYNMGCFYRTGRGVQRDVDEARRWFSRAAAKGFENAAINLACLDRDGL